MADDMYFSEDERSLHRGSRVAPRTDTCRPCVVHTLDKEKLNIHGVVLDINPHGMLVRMLEIVPLGTKVSIQLMRDDDFKIPFSSVHQGEIMRHIGTTGGFTDHGLSIANKEVRLHESKPIVIEQKRTIRPRQKSGMHNIDSTVGKSPRRR